MLWSQIQIITVFFLMKEVWAAVVMSLCGVFNPLKVIVSSTRCSTSSTEETSGPQRWGSLFIALQLLLWGASGNHSATLIQRWGGQTFLFWLSLLFCLMNKSTFLHTYTPSRSRLWVQLLLCSSFNIFRDDAARTVCSSLLSSYEQASRPVVEEFRCFTPVKVHSIQLHIEVLHSEVHIRKHYYL